MMSKEIYSEGTHDSARNVDVLSHGEGADAGDSGHDDSGDEGGLHFCPFGGMKLIE